MYWAPFLHLYQPSEQQPDILATVVGQSYRPLLRGLRDHPRARCTINVTGALLDLFDRHGYHDLIDDLRVLVRGGSVEFTGTAKYHALLPFLSEDEIARQITIHNETSRFYLGDAYQPKGFFPPEMAYAPKVGRVVAAMGFSWMILDEIARAGKPDTIQPRTLYTLAGTNLRLFFRHRRVSNLVMGAFVRSKKSLKEALTKDLVENKYIVTAMDGETFGHHRPGLMPLLFSILQDSTFSAIQISDIPKYFSRTQPIRPLASTWASSERDIRNKTQFLSWKEPGNPIHAAQGKLYALAAATVQKQAGKTKANKARLLMDRASASDHFWWASGKPWWSLEWVELGAFLLVEAVRQVPGVARTTVEQAERYYETITSTGFAWQRNGYIRKLAQDRRGILRIPFRDRAKNQALYKAFLALMRKHEKKSATTREYEQSILWRDAQYSLEHRLDIYDAVNAVNILETTVSDAELAKLLAHYRSRYSHMRGGQPEDRGA